MLAVEILGKRIRAGEQRHLQERNRVNPTYFEVALVPVF